MREGFALLWLSVFCLLLLGHRTAHRFFNTSVYLSFFDVGQGDAALIRLPGGKSLLLDAGLRSGRWDIGQRVLIPELARLGILHLEAAVLSHPDADHIGGFQSVMESLSVSEFWVAGFFLRSPQAPLLASTLRVAAARGVQVRSWRFPAHFEMAGVQFRLWTGPGPTSNDRSLLLWLRFRGCSAFFGGDVGAHVERGLALSALTLLKVSHHGSRFSSDAVFLKSVRARLAVISSGIDNRYGHPHPLVLENLVRAGTQVLRTDYHGRVDIRFDPDGTFHCSTVLGECGRGYCSPERPN